MTQSVLRPVARRAVWGLGAVAVAAGLLLAGSGYRHNQTLAFYAGAGPVVVGLFAMAAVGRRARGPLALLAATTTLLTLALPLADALTRPLPAPLGGGATLRPAFSYRQAGADPAAFRLWWDTYLDEGNKGRSTVSQRLPAGSQVPHVFKPGSSGYFFLNHVQINDYGFRGAPFDTAKAGRYRIVAVGASTTQGATILPHDRPWPEVLQDLIRDRLDCPCEVQVLNAGIEGYDPKDNLERLGRMVLPLRPDLVISYQGYMAFGLTGLGFVPHGPLRLIPRQAIPPAPQRPSRLLGALEYSLRLSYLEWTLPVVPAETYEALYRRLIAMADSAGVRLALATQTLAVTDSTPPEVVAFYSQAFPRVDKRVRANVENTRLLRQLGAEYPQVTVIHTEADLAGAWDGKYLDLFHFTQWGRNTLAWNMFKGIEPLLAQHPGCRPRPGVPPVPAGVAADPTPEADWDLLRQWLAARRVTPGTLSLDLMGPSNCRGFTHVEGPYPQWQTPFRFRWVTDAEATIQIWSDSADAAGGRRTRWHLGTHAAAQEVTLELDHQLWGRLNWGTEAGWRELDCTWPPLAPGEHSLTLRATQHVQYPSDPRRLYFMLGPMESGTGTGPVSAAPLSH